MHMSICVTYQTHFHLRYTTFVLFVSIQCQPFVSVNTYLRLSSVITNSKFEGKKQKQKQKQNKINK